MRDPASVIAEHLATWDTPFVELAIFGTSDATAIAAAVDGFARAHLGAAVAGYRFQTTSISSVHGVQLDDGRDLVIKAKPPAATHPTLPLDRASLEAIFVAQRHLAASGFPCPLPVLGPTPLGRGLATVETYLAPGEPRDPHDAHVRALLARGLHEHMVRLDPLLAAGAAPTHFGIPADRLFPRPHSQLFTPSEADADIRWVVDLASRARALAEAVPSPPRLGHCDWRIEHVQLRGDAIVATYDWDSLAVLPETRIVGVDAHGHTADWSQEAIRRTPTYDAIVGFIADYEAARPRPFSAAERRASRAWSCYWIAYGAWISIRPSERDWPDDSWPTLLRAAGARLLLEA